MPRKLAIIVDSENGFTQLFKRRDALVKVMGEVEKVLNFVNRQDKGLPAREGDLSRVAVKGGGVEGKWLDDIVDEAYRNGRTEGYQDGYEASADAALAAAKRGLIRPERTSDGTS